LQDMHIIERSLKAHRNLTAKEYKDASTLVLRPSVLKT
jgi:hypothetical protein